MLTTKMDIRMDMSKFNLIYKAARQARNQHLRFGWVDKKRYSSDKNKGLYVATVAYWQEFGTTANGKVHIPARPYFRQLANKVRYDYNGSIRTYFRAVCTGGATDVVLQSIGKKIVKDYRDIVGRQIHKKLATSTIKIKGHSYQLDHSGLLLSSFDYKVVKKAIGTQK